jgi:tRNA 2-selenouridine synthase
MIEQLSINDFLVAAEKMPAIDVRTPAEFEQGHIIGAYNIPLFSNEERILVGTTYKQEGREKAILLGFELTGAKWTSLIREAEKIAVDKNILLHCWRGGMRSAAMAWAFDLYGFKVTTLKNGYKAYRRSRIDAFENNYPFIILSGNTGCGKTKTLHELKKLYEQVIDLENIAQHQGSAFGSLGQMIQPTQEQFENILATELLKLDRKKRIWIEDESITVGKRVIPKNVFNQMLNTQAVRIDISKEERIDFLNKEYGNLDKDFLKDSVIRITKRLGPNETKLTLKAIDENKMKEFIELVLVYYDKTYLVSQNQRDQSAIHNLIFDKIDPSQNAKAIIDFCDKKFQHKIVHSQN